MKSRKPNYTELLSYFGVLQDFLLNQEESHHWKTNFEFKNDFDWGQKTEVSCFSLQSESRASGVKGIDQPELTAPLATERP